MDAHIAQNKNYLIDAFIADFLNNDTKIKREDLLKIANDDFRDVFLISTESMEEELMLILETTKINLEKKKVTVNSDNQERKILLEVLNSFLKHVHDSNELRPQVEANLRAFTVKKGGMEIEQELVEDEIIFFEDEKNFALRLQSNKDSAFYGANVSREPIHPGLVSIHPENYNYEKDYLSLTKKDLKNPIVQMLNHYADYYSQCLTINQFELYEEQNIPSFRKTVILARVVLAPEDIENNNYSSVKIEFLLKKDNVGFGLANFTLISNFLLFNNQVMVLSGTFNNHHLFKVEAILSTYSEFQQFNHPNPLSKISNDVALNMAILKGPFYQSLFKDKLEDNKTKEINFIYEQTPTFDDIVWKIRVLRDKHRINSLVIIGPIIPKNIAETPMEPSESTYEELVKSFFNKISELNIPNTFFVHDFEEMTNLSPIPVAVDDEFPHLAVGHIPNPSVLTLGGLSIGFTNSDTFGKLRKECLIRGFVDEKKIQQIMIQQILMSKNLQPMAPYKTGYDVSKYLQMSVDYVPQIMLVNSNGIDEIISVEQHDVHFVNLHSFIKKSRYGSFALVRYDSTQSNPLAIDIYSTPTD